MKSKRPFIIFSTFAAAMLITIGFAITKLGPSPLSWPAQLLVHNDHPQKADAIVILMGSVVSRSKHAADLFHQGVADTIIFAHPNISTSEKMGFRMNDAEATLKMLQQENISLDHIKYLDHTSVSSTREEALAILEYIERALPHAKKIVVVTDWYHTSRARWVYERVNVQRYSLAFSPATTKNSRPASWYQDEGAFLATFNEYLKWAYYLVKY